MKNYVDSAFGELLSDEESATRHFGTQPRPSPLGTISKLQEDGTQKDRIIQDMRRSALLTAGRLPGRQVLPRPTDRVLDLSNCAHVSNDGDNVHVTS